MTRAQVIAAYRHAAKLARAEGVTVTLDPGWTTRGRAGLIPSIIVEHDTSDGARLPAARMLDLLANGHGAIAGNAICNDAILTDGTVHVIATGLAWHAGNGVWRGHRGNGRALGTEYQRYIGDGLTDRQLEVGAIWTRARCAAFRIPTANVCEHHEYATPRGRKVDRSRRPGVRVDGATWRRQLTSSQPPTAEEDIVASIDDLRRVVREELDQRSHAADPLVRQRINESIRLDQASAAGAVAALRAAYGLPPDPASDAIQVARLRAGTHGGKPYGWAEAAATLRDAADRRG